MKCECCNKNKTILFNNLKVCFNCLRDDLKKSLPYIKKTHQKSRTIFNLPNEPPKSSNGISCDSCINECKLSNEKISYCGLRKNQNGKIIGVNKQKENVSWYLDNLPTTSGSHAEECKKVAEDAGLKNINIWNIRLLGNDY